MKKFKWSHLTIVLSVCLVLIAIPAGWYLYTFYPKAKHKIFGLQENNFVTIISTNNLLPLSCHNYLKVHLPKEFKIDKSFSQDSGSCTYSDKAKNFVYISISDESWKSTLDLYKVTLKNESTKDHQKFAEENSLVLKYKIFLDFLKNKSTLSILLSPNLLLAKNIVMLSSFERSPETLHYQTYKKNFLIKERFDETTKYIFQDENNHMFHVLVTIKDPAKENEVLSKLLTDGLGFNEKEFLLERDKPKSK